MTGGTPPVPGPGMQAASPTNGVPAQSPLVRSASEAASVGSGALGGAPERGGSAPVAQGGEAKAGGNDDKARAYRALLDLVQKTDASVVRQVVREHWGKCLTGSDYHSSFVVSLRVPALLSILLHFTHLELLLFMQNPGSIHRGICALTRSLWILRASLLCVTAAFPFFSFLLRMTYG